MNQSAGDPEEYKTKAYTDVKDLTAELKDKEVVIRARLARIKAKGKLCFYSLRQ